MPFLLPNQQRQSTEGVNGGNIIRTALCYVALRCLAYVQQAFFHRFTTLTIRISLCRSILA